MNSGIETYRVGLFDDLHALRIRWKHPKWTRCFVLFVRRFRRSWRRRSYWNGYLAEWHYAPEGVRHTKCGRGWTRRAALRRLGAHLVASNMLRAGGDRG